MHTRTTARAWLLPLTLTAFLLTRPAAASVTLLFSPQDNIEKVWVDHIHAARSRIHIACFGLSNKAIAAALADAAQNRHVEVIILEDPPSHAGVGAHRCTGARQ